MPADPNRVPDIFLDAVELPPERRPGFLADACRGDADLRVEVDRLLVANADPDSIFDSPPPTLMHTAASSPEAPSPSDIAAGDPPETGAETLDLADPDATTARGSITPAPLAANVSAGKSIGTLIAGRYRLGEVIGEGGMGTVYRAEQTEPVRRQVALKLIRTGLDSREVLARFDAERQALALMDHPNIARIYDGGATSLGQPFFVMEFVRGLPLTEYCDAQRLPVEARLELFVAVCQAVQHAHQKGIIHRDLKPGNVLVTEVDGRPTPKVIDFGVAKATEVKLTDMSFADVGAIVGTPTYMSPEQADPSSMDIDTRTDVYALGVMLYELLAGSPPIDASQFRRGAMLEMLRMVREVDPPRPSTKLSAAVALPNIAANRGGIEPARLSKLLRGELDWVVMKALEKDRNRRYETANALSRDIQRYLADEIVEARPPSVGYRLKKFVRRNKLQVIAAALVASALFAGMAGATWGLFEARRSAEGERLAKEDAKRKEKKAVAAAEQERMAKIDADTKRREAETNLAFATKGNAILGSVFAGLSPDRNYATLGEFRQALADNLKHAVKELDGSAIGDPLEVAAMQNTLGQSLLALGEWDLAIEVLQKSRDTRAARLGHDHPKTLFSEEALALGYEFSGKLNKALPLLQKALPLMKAELGTDNPHTLTLMNNLAMSLMEAGKLDQALPLFKETLALRKAKLGPDHIDTLASMANLAMGYGHAGMLDEAMSLEEETLARSTAKLGADHSDTLRVAHNLAESYRMAGKLDQALLMFERTNAATKAKLGPDHPDTLKSTGSLAAAYWSLKRLDKSVPMFEELLVLHEKKLGRDHPSTLMMVANLGVNYHDAGRFKESIPLLEEAHRASQQLAELRWVAVPLLDSYEKAGEHAKLVGVLQGQLADSRRSLPKDSPQLASVLVQLGGAWLTQKKWTEAEPLLRECKGIRETKEPDAWTTFNTESLLGEALLGQQKYAEAEPLLVKGYEGMKAREEKIPKSGGGELRIPEALDRLIEFYTATNKPDAVKKWQAERAKYPAVAPPPGEKN
jgi:tetratricopeptide (TPR) repeat protein